MIIFGTGDELISSDVQGGVRQQIKHCVIAAPLVFMGAPPPRERKKLIESGTRRVTRVCCFYLINKLPLTGSRETSRRSEQSIKRTIRAIFGEFSCLQNKHKGLNF